MLSQAHRVGLVTRSLLRHPRLDRGSSTENQIGAAEPSQASWFSLCVTRVHSSLCLIQSDPKIKAYVAPADAAPRALSASNSLAGLLPSASFFTRPPLRVLIAGPSEAGQHVNLEREDVGEVGG